MARRKSGAADVVATILQVGLILLLLLYILPLLFAKFAVSKSNRAVYGPPRPGPEVPGTGYSRADLLAMDWSPDEIAAMTAAEAPSPLSGILAGANSARLDFLTIGLPTETDYVFDGATHGGRFTYDETGNLDLQESW